MKKLNQKEQVAIKGGIIATNQRPASAPIFSSNTVGNISSLFSNIL